MAIAAVLGSLLGLAGCEGGPGKEATAPPTNTEGLAKTNDAVTKIEAKGDDYNEMMRKQQQQRQAKGSQYPGKK